MKSNASASRWSKLRASLKRIFFWHQQIGEEQHTHDASHDHALILALNEPTRMPRWRQWRFLIRLLTVREQKVFYISAGLFVLFFLIAVGAFTISHLTAVPLVGGTITEAIVGEPQHLNPLDAVLNATDQDLVSLIYSGLFRYDETHIVPDLAESYRWSDEGKTLTVNLRKDARFHDGQPVTAEDVVFTYQSIQDPERKLPLIDRFRTIEINASDDATVVFKLKSPDVTFLHQLTLGILPSQLWERVPASYARLSDLNIKPVGSGPYRVKSFLRDQSGDIHSYTLERFDMYYGIKPFIKTIVFQFFPDQLQAFEALKADLVDTLLFVDPTDAARLKESGRKQDVNISLPKTTVAFFNLKDSLLAKKEIRQSLVLATDRGQLIEAQDHSAVAIHGPFPFLETTSTETNLDHARQLLNDAGWVLPPNDQVRVYQPKKVVRKEEPSTKKTTTKKPTETPAPTASSTGDVANASSTALTLSIVTADDPKLIAIAQALARNWSLLGMRVSVETMSKDEVLRRARRDRDIQVLLIDILLQPDQDVLSFWWSGQTDRNGYNVSNVKDRDIDQSLQDIQNATSTEAYVVKQRELTSKLQALAPAIFISRPIDHYVLSKTIKGVPASMTTLRTSERFQSIEQWYVSTGWRWR